MKLDVVFTIDKGYLQHFCVALASLLENNRQVVGRVFLMVGKDFDEDWLTVVDKFIRTNYDKEIELLLIDDSLLKTFKVDKHISIATYFRIFISNLIPPELNQILFLDSDIIVNGDLSGIMEYKFDQSGSSEDYFAYAADHLFDENQYERLRPMGLTANSYFNAGVLWINLALFRQKNISQNAVDFINKHNAQLIFWDQDVLNVMFNGSCGKLDLKYNGFEQALKKVKNPVIIHYTGSLKPWHYASKHPYKKLYWFYLNMTPYRDFRYNDINLKTMVERFAPKWFIRVYKFALKRNRQSLN